MVNSPDGKEIQLDPGLACASLKMIFTDSVWLKQNAKERGTIETDHAFALIGKVFQLLLFYMKLLHVLYMYIERERINFDLPGLG